MHCLLPRSAGCALVALIASSLAAMTPAAAQESKSFYTGRTVSIIVGLGTGGGFDAYGRLLARHIGKHLGGANVIVQNMPGAGSLKATNYIFSVAPKDGTVIGITNPGVLLEPLYGNKAATFNPAEMSWIGAMNTEVSTCQIWHTAPVKTFDDLLKTELVVGGTGTGADSNLYPQVLNSVLGTKLKLVAGYAGTNEIYLAMERGELQGICGTYWSSVESSKSAELKEGKMIPLIQLALAKHPRHQNVPLVMDYAKDPKDRQTLELLFAPMKFARPFWAPPGLPAERVADLRKAFDAALVDPALIADAEKAKLELGPVPGAEIEGLIRRVYTTPKDVVATIVAARSAKK